MTRSWIAAALLSSLVGVTPVVAEGTDAPAPATEATSAPRARKAAKIPYRLVKLMPERDQAVVYDRDHAQHLLVQLGDDLGVFQVIDVDDEELVLWSDGREIVLTVDPSAPAPKAMLVHRPPRVVSATGPAPEVSATGAAPEVSATGPAPEVSATGAAPEVSATGPAPDGERVAASAPTATSAPAAESPLSPLMDPYGAAPTVTVVPAPTLASAGGAPAVVSAPAPIDPYGLPVAATVGPTVVLAPPAQRASLEGAEVLDPYAEPAVVPAPAAAAPIKGVPAPASDAARTAEIRAAVMPLQRTQLEDAVASFDRLAKDHGFVRTAGGVRVQRVAPTSFAYAIGLRAGDVITAIDGAPLRGLDDAAAAYVGLGSATQLSLDIERAGARGTLRFALR